MMYEVLNYRGEVVLLCWYGGMLELISDKDFGIFFIIYCFFNQILFVVILVWQLIRKV